MVVLILVGVVLGLWHTASTHPGFWDAFLPSFWATVIGVSLAALIGVPTGFIINNYVLRSAEKRRHGQLVVKAQELLAHVSSELKLHEGTLQQLAVVFPWAQSTQNALASTTSVSADTVANCRLSNVFLRQLLSDTTLFEIDEPIVSFQVGNYLARVDELNQMLGWRIQDTQHPQTWDQTIANVARTVWVVHIQVNLEIQNAIKRLGKSTSE